ncbi:MAG: glycosyltransferase, partial [Bradyrhizobium sp.]
PLLILRAFRLYLARYPQARLTFAGAQNSRLDAGIAKLGLTEQVECVGYRKDIQTLMAAADVLLAMDNLNEMPVYSLTKTVESLAVDRPFLLIAEEGSPDRELLARCGATAIAVAPGSDAVLADAMQRAMLLADAPGLYEERFAVMREYGGRRLAGELLHRMRDAITNAAETGSGT